MCVWGGGGVLLSLPVLRTTQARRVVASRLCCDAPNPETMWYYEEESRGIGSERGIRGIQIIKSIHPNSLLCETGAKRRNIFSTPPLLQFFCAS